MASGGRAQLFGMGEDTQFERDVSNERQKVNKHRATDLHTLANIIYDKLVHLKAHSGGNYLVVFGSDLHITRWPCGFTHRIDYSDTESCKEIIRQVHARTSYQYHCSIRGFGLFAADLADIPVLGRHLVCTEEFQ